MSAETPKIVLRFHRSCWYDQSSLITMELSLNNTKVAISNWSRPIFAIQNIVRMKYVMAAANTRNIFGSAIYDEFVIIQSLCW